MRVVMLSLVWVLMSLVAVAQTTTEVHPMTKKEKRKAQLEADFKATQHLLENKQFVLEADFLQDRYGNRAFVSSTINFVAVDSMEAVIQIGSNYRIGPNGVGGVTAKGRITKWELEPDYKRKTFALEMNVMTSIGIYDLRFTIGPSGNAKALLTGLRAGNLTFDGTVVSMEESRVFEGHSI